MKLWNDIFRETVEKYNTKTAIVYEENRMTYAELDVRSDHIAKSLRAKGVGRETIVAVMLERSIECVAAVLGIWKAGAAYVAIDLTYPKDRIEFMLRDCDVKTIIDKDYISGLDIMELADLPTDMGSHDLAAVIYTSGSTGNPKGVLLEQKSMAMTYHDLAEPRFGCAEDTFMINASTTFVAFIFAVILSLGRGMEVHLSSDRVRKDINQLKRYIEDHQVTITFATPQVGQFLTTADSPLKTLLISGDKAISFDCKHVQVINMLGLSEVNGVVTNYFCQNSVQENTPIGTPMQSVKLYLLDEQLNPVEKGEQGQICLAGPKVARGYLNRPDITAEKFIHNPFSTNEDEKILFLTGDIGRELADGNIEYVNRNDWMVNINGFRVEPGEIENQIKKIPAIKEAVVKGFVAQHNQNYLCVFYTLQNNITQDEITTEISNFLPEYMIPSMFVELAEIPLNANGKVDRKSLQAPIIAGKLSVDYQEPVNESQETICKAFEQVLDIKPVGINDDFFMLGGDSIKAMRLQLLCSNFGISMIQIMQQRTPANLAKTVSEVSTRPATETFAVREYYPLTENQLGLYYEWEKDNEVLQYNLPEVIKFSNKVDPTKLKTAVEKVITAHPYLKTCLGKRDGQVVQLRKENEPVCIEIVKVSEDDIQHIKASFVQPFDLFTGPLYRIVIYYTDKHTYLFMDIHHIIFDGSTFGIFTTDLVKAYKGEELRKENYTAFEHALEEEKMVGSEKYLEAEKFFDNILKDSMTELPKIAKGGREGYAKFVIINIPDTEIKRFCKENAVTPSSLFLAAFCYTLHRYTREERIAITTASAGRYKNKLMDIMGMFVKTLPIVIPISNGQSTLELTKAVQANMLETMENEIYPFTKMAEKYKFVPQINYVYQGGIAETFELEEQAVQIEVLALNKAKFPLSIAVTPRNADYELQIEYDESLYTQEYIETLGRAIAECANSMVENSEQSCETLAIIPVQDKVKILSQFQGRVLDYDKNATFIDLFSKQAQIHADNIALVDAVSSLSYEQADVYSDRLARELVRLGVTKNTFVGIMLPRRKEFMISVIAAMKAGGAYVPLDNEYPQERIEYMLQDSSAAVLITAKDIYEQKGLRVDNVILIDEFDFNAEQNRDIALASPERENLAYMIYTSGSTGKPKGVMIRHKSLSALLAWRAKDYGLTAADNMCCHSSFSFDASVYDLFVPLTLGGQLHIISEDMRQDMHSLQRYLIEHNITDGTFSTQLGMELINQFDVPLKSITLGGEKLKAVKKISGMLVNGYGPTEFTVSSSYHIVDQDKEYDNIPIGKPVANSWSYVMDETMNLLPIGVVGELCLAGEQIALGYWNKPELTAEKFIDNPLKTCSDNAKMYRTGDLVRWNADGELEYVGRIDNQIKLRGFRIELGEIESAIARFPGITASVADIKTIGVAQHLCGYFTADSDIDISQLLEYLRHGLTEYMIPTALVELDKIPLTPNGKVDKKALPVPVIEHQDLVPPQNEMQQQLFNIVASILGTEDFGITEDLFRVGMTSIQAIKLSVAIYNQFNINIRTNDIFQNKTIEKLEAIIKNTAKEEIETFAKREFYPLTENQLGLYYEWEKDRTAIQYNIPQVTKFSMQVDPEKLKAAAEKTLEAHPYLKTCLGMKDGQVVQLRRDDEQVHIELAKISEEDIPRIKETFVKPFDLFQEPLYRIAVYYTKQHTYLFTDIHHIIIDGSALGVFMADVVKAYNGEELAQETYTTFEHALEEEQLIGSERYLAAEKYFDEKLKNGMTELPRVTAGGGEKQSTFVTVSVSGDGINSFCKKNAVTPANLFLSAVCMTLHRYTGEEQIAITAISSGRNENKIDGIMGMLVKTLPVVVPIRPGENTLDYVKAVQNNMLETLSHEIYPFTKMVEKHKIAPLINYAYQGGMLEKIILEGQTAEMEGLALEKVKFPVIIFAMPKPDGYEVKIEYDNSLYTKDYIGNLCSAIAECAGQIAESQKMLCKDICIVNDNQLKMLEKFNETYTDYPISCGSIVEMFRRQAEKTPDRIAVVYEERKFTYQELDYITDKLAKHLKTLGVGAEQVVGVLIDRSEYMVIYPLAVLKAGGAYMPLDYTFPSDRLEFMIQDARVEFILSEQNMVEEHIPQFAGRIIKTEDISGIIVDESIPLPLPASHDMFVILYTSGSTGMPKGCILEHHNLVNYCKWHQSYYNITETDRSAAYANFGFDAHMLDIYPFITCGASTYVIPSNMRLDFIRLNQYFEENQLSIALMTTQIGSQFVEQFDNKSLRALLVGGEKLLPIKKPPYDFYNCYGPTECTIITTCHEIKQDYDSSIIGKPLDNYQLYVLDAGLQLVPPGVAGELCVGGAGVGRGYLNRDDVTAEKFIFWKGKRIYRTGDLVRWTPDGEIEYIGRMDGQVKLRGLRIELGEIEAQILSYEGITNCAVAVKEIGGSEHLCAYYTAANEVDQEKLKQQLATKLTAFMIPTAFTRLEVIPLTSNGKVNRKALPEPVIERQEIVPPQNETQQQIFDSVAGILATKDFGITDDFFSVGLTSILAIKLSVDIYKQFGVNIKTSDIFRNKTIEQLEQIIKNTTRKEETTSFAKLENYPLTENQLGLYYEWEKDRAALQYNIPQVTKFSKQVDPEKLKAAVEKTLEAHPYLKTCLGMKDGQVVQLRRDNEQVHIELAKVSEEDIQRIKETFVKPFDLFQEPLYRIAVYYTKQHTYLFTDIHHIIIDGSALGVFMADVVKAYNGEKLARESYTAFEHALEEEKMVGSEKYLEAESFFDNKLSDSMTELPKVTKGEGEGQEKLVCTTIHGKRIEQFCKNNAVTPSNLFLSALCNSLNRYTREERIAITTISSGRNETKLAGIMGMFVKTLPVVVQLNPGEKAIDFIKAVQENMFETMENEIYPFTKMVEKHKIVPYINYAYQGGMLETVKLEEQAVKTEGLALNKAKFPIAITLSPKKDSYEIAIEYDDSLYTEDYIATLTSAIAECAKQMAENPELLCKDISVINDEQKDLLDSFNPINDEYEDKTLQEIFEEIAKINGSHTALIAIDKTLSYKELNAFANRIANALIAKGIKPEDKVAFLLPRDSRLICTIFGIIKSGGAFIPVDPEYPEERIKHVLEDSNAKFIITTKRNQEKLKFSNGLVVDELLQYENKHNPQTGLKAKNLCYIIYTSGSTGKPKGVMIEHRNIVNYVLPLPSNFYINKVVGTCSTMLSVTTVAFDVFLEEALVTLANGLTMVFADDDQAMNPMLLANLITKNNIDVMSTTPSRIMQYVEADEFAKALGHVKLIICGGEKFPANFFTALRKYTTALIYNTYGPTETTIATNAKELNNEQITIGKALSNVKLYVVDQDLNRLPIGVVGELLIGGKGVGRGYLNRPELTSEKFVLFNGERVYRSGDYARWNADGEIDIIGRMDNQIKLRGLRIELGEIEAHMNEYEDITASVVIIKKLQNADYLCAYFTAKDKIDCNDLREYLKKKLTAYMVPATFTQLDKMPVTLNGKVDQKALPVPELQNLNEYVAPTNELEAKLCQIFAETLQLEQVGITDSFFGIGGTSLLVMKVVVKAMAMDIGITYGNVFTYQTPQKLAEFVSSSVKETSIIDTGAYDYSAIVQLLVKNSLGEITENPLGDILLTGATGFLGIHVLKEFLDNYPGKVYCLMRSQDGNSADMRLKVRLVYYFDNDYAELFGNRLFTLEGDITEPESITVKVDAVLNCAAMVKHFAVGDELAKVNVDGVRNLIQYCREQDAMLIQISTASVAGVADASMQGLKMKESDLYLGQIIENKYVHSKFQAERCVLEAATKGLRAKIMRVGNLMARSQDGEFQLNFQGNSFMNSLKSYKLLGKFPISRMGGEAEFSPIDCTAKAVLKLAQSSNEYTVFHPYNNHFVYMADVIYAMKEYGFPIEIVSDQEFEQCLREKMQDETIMSALTGILAYQENDTEKPVYVLGSSNQFTTEVLYRLNFVWPVTSEVYIKKAIEALDSLGFFDVQFKPE